MTEANANAPSIGSGDVIGGKYRVERVIGQGGMGTVVRARHTLLEQDVAIKVLATELSADPQYAARFLREAQTAVSIKSEHVARVLDVGTRENGAPYMVMEYLEGKDLGAVIETSGPLQIADAIDYMLQACEALAEAHVAGLTHRDIKPSNIFLAKRSDGSPLVKLLDFGIAKPAAATDSQLTATGAAMGSPSYMSPEQVRNAKNVDHRSDLWSLGASLHELLAGTPPFRAETFPALCAAIIADEPTALREKRPDAPLEIENAIAKCLDKKADGRFADVGALARAIAPFGGPSAQISVERITKIVSPGMVNVPVESISRVSIMPPKGPDASAFAATAASTGSNVPEVAAPRKRSLFVYVAGGVFAVFVTAGIFVTVREKPGGATPETQQSADVDGRVKPNASNASSAVPVIVPAGTATVPPEAAVSAGASGSLPVVVAPSSAPSNSSAITARPIGSAKPVSSKSTKKNPTYDPFADQH
jgi:serine/threonine-protein kinase